MEMLATTHRPLQQERPAIERGRVPSLLSTAVSYFIIIYLYSSLGWIVMLLYPGIRVSYFLYFLLATLPFLAAVNRSVIDVIRDHWPFLLLISLYLGYISIQYAFLGMADMELVRDMYFVKAQFVAGVLVSLIAFELCFDFRKLLVALYLVVIASCVINVIEFFDPLALPIKLSVAIGRAAGLYQNPNVSAMFIASPIPLLCARMGRMGRLICYAITGIGVFLTFSRGGWALWFAAVVVTEMTNIDWKRVRLSPQSIAALAGISISAIALIVTFAPALSLLVGGLRSNLDTDTVTRLEILGNDTTASRLELARHGLEAFASAPIFGTGVGYTSVWVYGLSVHNMFVLMLAEQGILGFIWLIALLVVWWRYPRPYGWWLVVLFCVTAMTTHNYFDESLPAIIITLYLVASHKLSGYRQPGYR
jgi:O-antigen ligase